MDVHHRRQSAALSVRHVNYVFVRPFRCDVDVNSVRLSVFGNFAQPADGQFAFTENRMNKSPTIGVFFSCIVLVCWKSSDTIGFESISYANRTQHISFRIRITVESDTTTTYMQTCPCLDIVHFDRMRRQARTYVVLYVDMHTIRSVWFVVAFVCLCRVWLAGMVFDVRACPPPPPSSPPWRVCQLHVECVCPTCLPELHQR